MASPRPRHLGCAALRLRRLVTAARLGGAFESRSIVKRYLAVVRGWPEPAGSIEHPLRRLEDGKDVGDADGPRQDARTDYTRLACAAVPIPSRHHDTTRVALLELFPRSGRQHQIRRHLKHISHPVLGDATYGKGPLNRAFAALFGTGRLLLACVDLHLAHPADGRPLRLHAPLEPAFAGLCATLGWPQVAEDSDPEGTLGAWLHGSSTSSPSQTTDAGDSARLRASRRRDKIGRRDEGARPREVPMRFGHFDDAAREYVIETPRTPYPWINYLGTEEFFGLVSHTRRAATASTGTPGSGGSPATATTTSRPTSGGRYFYVQRRRRLLDAGLGPGQARARRLRVPASASRTRGSPDAGRGSRPRSSTSSRSARTPRSTRSRSATSRGSKKSVKLFSFVEFCLWNAWDDQTNYQRNLSIGEVEVDGQHDLPQDRVPRAAQPLRVLHREREGEGLRHRPRELPRPVQRLRRARRSWPRGARASRWPAAGRRSARTSSTSTLAPGEEKTFVFVLGYVENPVEEKWERPGVINKTRAATTDRPLPTRPPRWTRRSRRCATTGRDALAPTW